MKACKVHKTKKEYKIITVYQRESGILHLKDPIFIIPIASSNQDLSNYIFSSLNSSKKIKDSELANPKDFLKLLKESSFKNLYKHSTSCMIILDKGKLEIIPYKGATDGRGLEEVDEDKRLFDYSKENEGFITTSVIEILNHKY